MCIERERRRMSSIATVRNNQLICDGVLIPFTNPFQPSSPAYRALFPCEREGLNGPIRFIEFNFFYLSTTSMGTVIWKIQTSAVIFNTEFPLADLSLSDNRYTVTFQPNATFGIALYKTTDTDSTLTIINLSNGT